MPSRESLLVFLNRIGAAVAKQPGGPGRARSEGQWLPRRRGCCGAPARGGLRRACWAAPGRTNIVCPLPARGCRPGRCRLAEMEGTSLFLEPGTEPSFYSCWKRSPCRHEMPRRRQRRQRRRLFVQLFLQSGGEHGSPVPGGGTGTRDRTRATPKAACQPPSSQPWHKGREPAVGATRMLPAPAGHSQPQGAPAEAGGRRSRSASAWGLSSSRETLPTHLGVIHGKFERNSTSVGVPGSEWALEGVNIPLLHSSPHLIELQKPSSYAVHEVPSHHPLSLYWYLHIYNKLASSGEQPAFSKSRLTWGAELGAEPTHPTAGSRGSRFVLTSHAPAAGSTGFSPRKSR